MSRPDDGARTPRRRHGAPDPYPAESYDHGTEPAGPGDQPYGWDPGPAPQRRSRTAVTALVLGVLAIPLFFTVYIGALIGLLGLVFGIIALTATRGGRLLGRAMAVTGTICALIGLTMSIALGAYGIRTYRDCQQRLGHKPTIAEVRDCTRR